jgi:hypothetical protein
MRRIAAIWLVVLVAGCGKELQVAGPSPAPPPHAAKVVAIVVREGVLLKAEHLDGVRQVEGVLEWGPSDLGYQAFDRGQWWFSTADWEWVMVPNRGRMFWGVFRQEAVSGDGMLGLIRFNGAPSLQGLKVWIDGQRADGETEDQRERPGAGADGLVPAASGLLEGVQGQPSGYAWYLRELGPVR